MLFVQSDTESLVPQPGGFEGFVEGPKVSDLGDLSVAKHVGDPDSGLEGVFGALYDGVRVKRHDHVAPFIDQSLRFDVVSLEGAPQVHVEADDLVAAMQGVRMEDVPGRRAQDHIRSEILVEGSPQVVAAAVVGGADLVQDLDVLLRRRLLR
jgi:hypothetical protein